MGYILIIYSDNIMMNCLLYSIYVVVSFLADVGLPVTSIIATGVLVVVATIYFNVLISLLS